MNAIDYTEVNACREKETAAWNNYFHNSTSENFQLWKAAFRELEEAWRAIRPAMIAKLKAEKQQKSSS